MSIDMRTVVLLSIIIYITCTLFMMQLWIQNRSRFSGLGFLLLDFSLLTTAFILIILRGSVPDWMSIILSNSFVIIGSISGYFGLLRFIDKKGSQLHNLVLFFFFLSAQIYFTLVYPSLDLRNINISFALLIICIQCCWILLRGVGDELRPLTTGAGMVFGGYCLVSIFRITMYFFTDHPERDFFHSGTLQALIIIIYLVLFIMLFYSIVMMVNKRLIIEIGIQEQKFAKAFHSAPYAITLTRLSDGTIFDANEGFTAITGYERSEVIGKKTLELNIWDNIEDRSLIIDIISRKGKVDGIDMEFKKKNGEPLTGHLSAEIIMINGEKSILSSIADITERKLAEDKIRNLLAEKEMILKEVHHRIKNNMNTINSLLNIQAETIKEPAAAAALEDAGSRVQSMMVLYDQLYQSTDINDVSLKDYLPALITQIVRNFPNSQSVKVENHIDDFILDVKSVSSVGILINELLTNIMKHAFTGRADGLITVSASLNKDIVTIIVQDNGIGLPESIDFENPKGFGFSLVDMLTKQLKGTMQIERMDGAKFILKFHK